MPELASVFSLSRRIVPCERCAQPVESSAGEVTCSACGARFDLAPRPATDVPRGAEPGSDDGSRRRVLAEADLRARAAEVEAEQLEGTRAAWLACRASLAAPTEDAETRLVLLTTLLANASLRSGEDRPLRAFLEGALEAVRAPRHRQGLRAWLARQATRQGDLEAAEGWLAGCDPTSDDEEMAGTYRVARAQMATAKGDGAAVLALLGRSGEAQALPASVAGLAAILRANALEKTGELDLACEALRRAATTVAQRMSQANTIANLPSAWEVCARSLVAESRRRAFERLALGNRAFPIVVGATLSLAAITGAVILSGGDALLDGLMGGGTAVLALASVAERRSKARQRAVIAEGRFVRARVVRDPYEVRSTLHKETGRGGTRNWRFELEIVERCADAGAAEPRRAIMVPYLTHAEAIRVNGREVVVFVHPDRPGDAVLAL